jgi:hypothetical protein
MPALNATTTTTITDDGKLVVIVSIENIAKRRATFAVRNSLTALIQA